MKIYLAGPMPTQNNWRNKIKKKMSDMIFFDPDDFENQASDSTVVNYDKAVIKKSDFMIANITRLSAGTSMEILFAFDNNIPVMIICEDFDLLNPWHRHHASFICENIDQGIKKIKKFKSMIG